MSPAAARRTRPGVAAAGLVLLTLLIFGALPRAQAQEPAPLSDAASPSLDVVLGLPVRIGAPWRETQDQLYAARCTAEDSPLFDAMDCRSDLSLGPLSLGGPQGEGVTAISDDHATLDRVSAGRSTSERPVSCDAFMGGVSRSLSQLGVRTTLSRVASVLRLQNTVAGEQRLRIECRPETQTLELADAWVDLVPGGTCPGLRAAPPQLRAVADSVLTKIVHDDPDELGLACNKPGLTVNVFAGRWMGALVVAYLSLGLSVPASPPDWLLSQIHDGLASASLKADQLPEASRRRLAAYILRAQSLPYLRSLWARVSHAEQVAQRSNAQPHTAASPASTGRKHSR